MSGLRLLYPIILIVVGCGICRAEHFQIIKQKQVATTFETLSSPSVLECVSACAQKARMSASCLSANYHHGNQTCGLSGSYGNDLIYADSDQAVVLLPLDIGNCTDPGPLTNGSYIVTSDIVIYSCDTGFRISGATTRTCVTGRWSEVPPVCIQDGCPDPPTLPNGYYCYGGDITINYCCHWGYTLQGNSTITCTAGGWIGTLPTCVLVDCGVFLNPYINTMVSTPTCTTLGCTLDITCMTGFKEPTPPPSPYRVTCSADHMWTVDPSDPDCSYELMFRGTAGNGYDISAAYLYGNAADGVTSNETCMNVHNTGCTLHYRNSRIDSWSTLGITNILYEMYNGGATVTSVTFNGTGSTMANWMGEDGPLKATSWWPWTDLTSNDVSWWSLFNNIEDGRVFRILDSYNGECNDYYFSVVLFEPNYGCNYELTGPWPTFLYSANTMDVNFNTEPYERASSMAVWVQTSS